MGQESSQLQESQKEVAPRILFAEQSHKIVALEHKNLLLVTQIRKKSRQLNDYATRLPRLLRENNRLRRVVSRQKKANKKNDERISNLLQELEELNQINVSLSHEKTMLSRNNIHFEQQLSQLQHELSQQQKHLRLTNLVLEATSEKKTVPDA